VTSYESRGLYRYEVVFAAMVLAAAWILAFAMGVLS